MSQHPAPPDGGSAPRPSPEHARLGVFVGSWRTQGELLSDSPGGPATPLRATDRYEWLPGGFFLLHHVDARVGDAVVHALEVIGFDERRGEYFSHAYDGGGTMTTYAARLDGDRWRIEGATERFAGAFSADRQLLTGRWERLVDGAGWVPWMTLTLTKAVDGW